MPRLQYPVVPGSLGEELLLPLMAEVQQHVGVEVHDGSQVVLASGVLASGVLASLLPPSCVAVRYLHIGSGCVFVQVRMPRRDSLGTRYYLVHRPPHNRRRAMQ
jgi:hypothetical protein